MIKQRYSLWIIPPREIADRLKDIIKELKETYHGPMITPHMTITGNITHLSKQNILERAEEFAANTNPYNIHAGEIDASDHYYRSVFLKIKQTPEVIANYEDAKPYFIREDQHHPLIYTPHISLMYGTQNILTSKKIAKSLEAKIQLPISFTGESVVVYSTSGKPEDWIRIQEFSFKKI